ncbi:MAG: hypothetical protein WCY87_03425 [Candidatus Cloacimonadales bacterium]|jgi:hypothetical protein|nr:hypothetical protein [Candidatus Cloacimonadota bacterium]MDY0380519.1 hypothetical protein [Candidatus Cloacimonadaceae bacterium]HCM16357.1 hypothetical protein [Candidatus Cloacimonas sp.]MCB5256414.1 hypothetical protein [Candidatus Cloacimonadota bacterium]MCB5263389.1 hypothetical protein [Candidatus Cloacimonadota bacterium]
MKKSIMLFLIFAISVGLCAQSAKQEALQSLDQAKNLINQNNLLKAQDELNYAQSKLGELLSAELLKFIPDAPTGFVLEDRQAANLGQAGAIIGSANAISANGMYTKGDADFDLSITVGGLVGQSGGLAGLAALFGGMSTSNTRNTRIKGYNATVEYDGSELSGTLTIKVGEKITVIVQGDDIENTDMLNTLAETIDLAGLEKAF